jgi:hypothetical protein
MEKMSATEFIFNEFGKLKQYEILALFTDSDIIYVLNAAINTYNVTYVSGKFPRTFANVNDFLSSIDERISIVELPDGKMFFP